MKRLLIPLMSLAVIASAPFVNAGTHVWSGAVNNSWSNPGNWSSGGAPQFGEPNLALVFPANATRFAATNYVGNFAINSMTIQGNNYAIGGYGITLLYNGIGASILCSGANHEIALPMTLNAPGLGFTVGTASDLRLSGELSGPGSFTKYGYGNLTLAGTLDNTYAGVTKVLAGKIYLNQGDLFNAIAIPGDLIVGNAGNNTTEIDVLFQRANQVADTAAVTVNQNCYFALQGHSDGIGRLVLQGGQVMTDLANPKVAGTLTLFGNVAALANSQVPSAIAGHLSLGGATRTFDVTNGASLAVYAQVSDGAGMGGINKSGEGKMRMGGIDALSPSTFNGAVTVSQGTLDVVYAGALGSTVGGTRVQSGATLWIAGITITGEPLYLNGAGYVPPIFAAPGALEAANSDATWAGPMTLETDTTINVAENIKLTLSGAINGPGSLTLHDLGTVMITGGNANTYTGSTYAHGGLLLLGKNALVPAVPGPLFVGQPNPAADWQIVPQTNVVRLLASEQLGASAPLSIDVSGLLDLDGYSQTVGPLTMSGGVITNTAGTLTLDGDVTGSTLWNNWPTIHGKISLGGGTRTFTSLTPGAIFLEGPVSDGWRSAGIIKMGPYGLWLSNPNNTYSGITHIKEGWLAVHKPGGLGSPVAGTIVEGNAELSIGLDFHGPTELLTLNDGAALYSVGNNSWDGNIAVNGNPRILVDPLGNNQTLDITGMIYGNGGLTFERGGTLRFGGSMPNTYSGPTTVLGTTTWNTVSTLELRKPNGVIAVPGPLIIGSATNPPAHEIVRLFAYDQIADSAAVTVNASGLLDLNNNDDTIGSLAGAGQVEMKLGILTHGGNNASTTFSGTIAGTSWAAQFVKEGTGALTLTGNNTLSGSMMINNGSLYANGQQTSSIFVSPNGKLHGQGTVGYITGLGGWTVPGDNLTPPSHGALKSKSLTLDAASAFNIDLGGTQEGVNYDQLVVTGSVNLGDATLHLTESFAGSANNQFVIIRNDGADVVQGEFKNLSEGANFSVNGAQFQITYKGGDGNDVMITQVTATPSPTMNGVTPLANGQIQLTGSGIPGLTYAVQATGSLTPPVQWTNIGTATANAQGQLQFTDADAPNHPIRFYRFQLP